MEALFQGPDKDRSRNCDPVCWFSMKKRRAADLKFVAALKKKFCVEKVDLQKRQKEEYGNIFLLVFLILVLSRVLIWLRYRVTRKESLPTCSDFAL